MLYVALLYLYQQFYAEVDLAPEDVGLDRTAVLVRAIGAVVILVALAAVASAVLFIVSFCAWLVRSFSNWLLEIGYRYEGASRDTAQQLASRKEPVRLLAVLDRPLRYYLTFGFMPHQSRTPFKRLFERRRLLLFVGSGAMITVLLGFWFLLSRDRSLAADAAAGDAVTPIEVAGLSVLDIRSVPATVTWVGSGTSPTDLKGSLHFLGRSATMVYLRSGHQTLSVSANSVVVVLTGP